MSRRGRSVGTILLCLIEAVWLAPLAAAEAPAEVEFFEKKIRPVLVSKCLKCHSAQKSSGKLRVDSRAALLRGGASGPALVPSNPEVSLFLKALRHQDAEL